jgi:ATP-dependent DNA helicase RecQ
VCIEKRKKNNVRAFDTLREEVLTVMKNRTITLEELEEQVAPEDKELFVDVVREMVDEGTLAYDQAWKLKLSGKNKQPADGK